MSLKLPKCEFCVNFIGYEKTVMRCKAFPDGIPDDKNIYDYNDNTECANGIKFEENDRYSSKTV